MSRVEFFPKHNFLLGIQKLAGFSNLYLWEYNNLELLDYKKDVEGYIIHSCFSTDGKFWAATIDNKKVIICNTK